MPEARMAAHHGSLGLLLGFSLVGFRVLGFKACALGFNIRDLGAFEGFMVQGFGASPSPETLDALNPKP